MSMRRLWFAALTISIWWAIFSSRSVVAVPAAPGADDVIARYVGTTPGTASGHKVLMLGVTVVSNGKNARIPIPNEDPKKIGDAVPKADLDTAIKKLTVGQVVKISIDPANKDYGPCLSTIEPYDTKPGEDTPNGYVFSKTFPGPNDTIKAVVLTKFGVEYSFTIGTVKDEKGAQVQDPDLVAAVGKLSPDAGVWVQTVGKKIVAIEPYAEPQTGKVTKLIDADVNGHKVKSAEIDGDDGKPVTVYVPGKEVGKAFVPDNLVLAQLAKVKVGSQVEFRAHEDGDKLWLREISAVKAGAKKPAEAMPAKK